MLTAIALASCASSLSNKASAPANLAALPEQAPNVDSATPAKAAIPRPQLIKSADISIQVKSIEDTTKAISDLVKQQQGDIDSEPAMASHRKHLQKFFRIEFYASILDYSS